VCLQRRIITGGGIPVKPMADAHRPSATLSRAGSTLDDIAASGPKILSLHRRLRRVAGRPCFAALGGAAAGPEGPRTVLSNPKCQSGSGLKTLNLSAAFRREKSSKSQGFLRL
jgi:hypothetical protein